MPQFRTARVRPVSFFARQGDDGPDLWIVGAGECETRMNDTGLWHPWLRINRVLRGMRQTLERGGADGGQGRVQDGARPAERDSARGVVQLMISA